MSVTLADSLTHPVSSLGLVDGLGYVAYVAASWVGPGLIWAFTARRAGTSAHPWGVIGVGGLLAWCASIALNLLPLPRALSQIVAAPLARTIPLGDLAVYFVWTHLFYGGLYAAGYLSVRRALALRTQLDALRSARAQAELQLSEMRLSAWEGQLQPAMLLEALRKLRVLYGHGGGARAEALFDQLVAFLRAAMPGLRGGASTLTAELELLSAYAELRKSLEGVVPSWRLVGARPPPTLVVPPMTLLPALDLAGRALGPGSTLEIYGPGPAREDALDLAPRPAPGGASHTVSQVVDELREMLGARRVETDGGPAVRLTAGPAALPAAA